MVRFFVRSAVLVSPGNLNEMAKGNGQGIGCIGRGGQAAQVQMLLDEGRHALFRGRAFTDYGALHQGRGIFGYGYFREGGCRHDHPTRMPENQGRTSELGVENAFEGQNLRVIETEQLAQFALDMTQPHGKLVTILGAYHTIFQDPDFLRQAFEKGIACAQ